MRTIGLTAPVLPTLDELRRVREAMHPARVRGMDCHVLDARYEPGSRCTVLYRVDDQLLVGTVWFDQGSRDIRAQGNPAETLWTDSLGIEVHSLPLDPSLPGLADALRPEIMTRALTDALSASPMGATQVVRCRAAIERYRPSRSCTLRLDVWMRDAATGALGRRHLFGKVYPTRAKAESVYATMTEMAGLTDSGSGRLRVALPVASVPSLRMVVQEPLPGTSLDLFLRRRAFARTPAHAAAPIRWAAQALAELHALDLTHPRQRRVELELDRLVTRFAAAKAIDAELDAAIRELVDRLRAGLLDLGLEGQPGRVVHADCKPSQYLVHTDGVVLLDFDHAGMADPALDVGTFMASLRQLGCRRALERNRPLTGAEAAWVREHEVAFLQGYIGAADEADGFPVRVAWYEAFGLLRKARRAMCRSLRSPLPRLLVDEAMECLDPRRRAAS